MNGPVSDKNHQTRVKYDFSKISSVLSALGQLKAEYIDLLPMICVSPHSNYCALHQSIGTETRNIEHFRTDECCSIQIFLQSLMENQ